MTTPNATTSFDRREFLKASGVLAIGFSMFGAAGPAGATALRAPKSARAVPKETKPPVEAEPPPALVKEPPA